jgi:hypothetical protein
MTARQPWLGIKTRDWFINSDTPHLPAPGHRVSTTQLGPRCRWLGAPGPRSGVGRLPRRAF